MAIFTPLIKDHNVKLASLALAGILAAGSGARAAQPTDIGYAPSNVRIVSSSKKQVDCSGEVADIKKGLRLSATAVSQAFNVSRQTVYNWLAGETPRPEYREKIYALADAARVIHSAGATNGLQLSQPLVGGSSFWELVSQGKDPRELADTIVKNADRRRAQREFSAMRLREKRAGGQATDLLADDDIG